MGNIVSRATTVRYGWWLGVVALIVVFVIGFLVYEGVNVRPNLKPITDRDLEPYKAIGKLLEAARLQPSLQIDKNSVGFPEREAELGILREAVYVFQVRFHRLPNSLGELPQIIQDGPGAERGREELREASTRCKIFTFVSGSYILNCDGWNPDQSRLDGARSGFNQKTIKYYLVDGHVVTYAPPFTE